MNEASYKTFFGAIANRTRCAIVQLLKKGPRSVTELCKKLGFEQSRVSHNLKYLEKSGFVNGEYKGKNRIYSLAPEVVSILNSVDKHLIKYQGHLKSCGVLDTHKTSQVD